MGVLLPNTTLGVRRHADGAADGHGYRKTTSLGALATPGPGHAEELPDRSWRLRVPPECWPIRERDVIAEPNGGRSWTVLNADLLKHSIDPVCDYVRVEAELRRNGGTQTTDSPTPPPNSF